MKAFLLSLLLVWSCTSMAQIIKANVDDEPKPAAAIYKLGVSIPFTANNDYFSEGVMTLNKAMQQPFHLLDDRMFSNKKSFGSILFRAGKVILIDGLIGSFTSLVNHEVGGHHLAFKQLGAPKTTIQIGLFSGSVGVSNLWASDNLTPQENAYIDLSGMLTERSVANIMALNNASTGYFDADFSYLSVAGRLNTLMYYIGGDLNSQGNDLMNTLRYYNTTLGKTKYKVKTIALKASLINALNPHFLGSLFALGNYLGGGSSKTKIPFIKLGNLQYLPGLSYQLTPYGEQYELESYVKYHGKTAQVNIGFGDSELNNHFHCNAKTANLFNFPRQANKQLILDAQAALWSQKKWGGMFGLDLKYLYKQIGFGVQLAHKSSGFYQGFTSDENAFIVGMNLLIAMY